MLKATIVPGTEINCGEKYEVCQVAEGTELSWAVRNKDTGTLHAGYLSADAAIEHARALQLESDNW